MPVEERLLSLPCNGSGEKSFRKSDAGIHVSIMNHIDNFTIFLVSGIILNITPGPDTFYILSRSMAQGQKAGVLSVLGISSGGIIHTCLAAFGLSLVLARSAVAFTIIKYLGAGYIVYLGIRIIARNETLLDENVFQAVEMKPYGIFWQGMMTNLFNPKVALFFISFLPQFINPGAVNNPVPFLVLGATFITTGTAWCLFLACAASFISRKLRENDKTALIMRKLCGTVFICLGIKLVI